MDGPENISEGLESGKRFSLMTLRYALLLTKVLLMVYFAIILISELLNCIFDIL